LPAIFAYYLGNSALARRKARMEESGDGLVCSIDCNFDSHYWRALFD